VTFKCVFLLLDLRTWVKVLHSYSPYWEKQVLQYNTGK
jgi:hypothetical protein